MPRLTSLAVSTTGGTWLVDAETGNTLKTLKQAETSPHGLTIVSNTLLIAQPGRPVIHLFSPSKEAPLRRIVVSEPVSSLSVSPCGRFVAAGSAHGRTYVWRIASGALVWVGEPHFLAVSSLQWTHDGAALVTAGADARICIIRMSDWHVVHTLSHHSMAVTALAVGAGRWREARIFSASQDSTVVVTDLASGRILHTLVFESPLTALAVDPAERQLYVGNAQGVTFVPLYRIHDGKLAAVGGGGMLLSPDEDKVEIEGEVTALKLTADGTQLVVGSTEAVALMDVGTQQLVRKLRGPKGTAVALEWVDAEATPKEIPALQRTRESEPTDFVPPEQHLEEFPLPTLEDEFSEIEFALGGRNDSGASGSGDGEASGSASAAESDQVKNLKAMYDELWKRHSALLAESSTNNK